MATGRYIPESMVGDLMAMLADWKRSPNSHSHGPNKSHQLFENDNMVKVKITSVITSQGGRYNGKLIGDGVIDVTAGSTSHLATSNLGALSSAENVLIWNLSEISSTGHNIDLADDSQCVKIGYLGTYDSVQKKWVVLVSNSIASSSVVRLKITSIISGQGGRYNGKTISGATNSVGVFGLTPSDFGTVAASEDCIVWNIGEMGVATGHFINLSDNTKIYQLGTSFGTDTASGKPVYIVRVPGLMAHFTVNCAATSGSAGTYNTQCSYVYTATDPVSGSTLGTGLTPKRARPSAGAMNSGTIGTGYYDASGNFQLYCANECITVESCT